MGFLGMFGRKMKDIDIPPPPPPILASEPVPEPLAPLERSFTPPLHPEVEQAVNIDEFVHQGRQPVFGMERPTVPDFSRPIQMQGTGLAEVSPEDFISSFPEEPSLEDIHKPEPLVPPQRQEEFREISPALKHLEELELQKQEKRPLLTNQSLFVKADDYKSILGAMAVIKTKIEDSEKILNDLNELKNVKDKSFEKWRTELEDIQRKLLYIDKTVYEKR